LAKFDNPIAPNTSNQQTTHPAHIILQEVIIGTLQNMTN